MDQQALTSPASPMNMYEYKRSTQAFAYHFLAEVEIYIPIFLGNAKEM